MHLPAMRLPYQTLVVIVLIGLVVGVIGAYIENWLAPRLGVHFGTGLVRIGLNATLGAIVLLLLVRLIRRV
jgi:uncharacterized membrane protein YeaQ/YmgE (transglycosylase-associated protein family)